MYGTNLVLILKTFRRDSKRILYFYSMKYFFKVILILNVGFVVAQTYDFTQVNNLLDSLEQREMMGLVVQLKQGDTTLFERSLGYSNYQSKEKNDPSILYKIGSITKMFTSVMLLQLEEEGKINLNDKLSDYYPNIKNSEKVSLEQMLQHRSGLKDYTRLANFDEIVVQDWSKNQILYLLESFEPEFEADEKFEYSNTNYLLLGYILEDLEQTSYSKILQKRIAKPLSLDHTYMIGENHQWPEAKSYSEDTEISQWELCWSSAAGGIISNAEDLHFFLRALFNDQLIKPSSKVKMLETKDNYGLGIMLLPFYNHQSFGHSGGIEGFLTSVAYFPDKNIYMTILSNENKDFKVNNNDIAIALLSAVYDKPYEIPDLEITATEEIDIQVLQSLTGVYQVDSFPLDITIFIKNGGLMGRATGQSDFPLRCINAKELIFEFDPANISMQFHQEKEGMLMDYKQYKTELQFWRKPTP